MPLMTYLISGLDDTSIAAREASVDVSDAQAMNETGRTEQSARDELNPYSKQESEAERFRIDTPTNRSVVKPRQSKPDLQLHRSGAPIPRPRTIFTKGNLENTILSDQPVRPSRAIDKLAQLSEPPIPMPRSVNHAVLTTRSNTKIYRVRSVRMSESSTWSRCYSSRFNKPQRFEINLEFSPHPLLRPTPQRFDPYEARSGYIDDGYGGLILESWP